MADRRDVIFYYVGDHWQFNLVSTDPDSSRTYTFQINFKSGVIQFTVAVK
jgi:hypothetical protein